MTIIYTEKKAGESSLTRFQARGSDNLKMDMM